MIRKIKRFFSQVDEKNKIYILSLLVGLLSGTAAFVLKNFIIT